MAIHPKRMKAAKATVIKNMKAAGAPSDHMQFVRKLTDSQMLVYHKFLNAYGNDSSVQPLDVCENDVQRAIMRDYAPWKITRIMDVVHALRDHYLEENA